MEGNIIRRMLNREQSMHYLKIGFIEKENNANIVFVGHDMRFRKRFYRRHLRVCPEGAKNIL